MVDPVVKGILLVAFVIICILLVLLVLAQEPENSGMGGLLGGGNSMAFGAHSASVLTKLTVVFVVLFFVATFGIAKVFSNKTTSDAKNLQKLSDESAVELPAEESGATGAANSEAAQNGHWWNKDSQ